MQWPVVFRVAFSIEGCIFLEASGIGKNSIARVANLRTCVAFRDQVGRYKGIECSGDDCHFYCQVCIKDMVDLRIEQISATTSLKLCAKSV